MGLSDLHPDNDQLLQFAFQIDVVMGFLSKPFSLTQKLIDYLQHYVFSVGTKFCDLFNVDVSTKLNQLMRLVNHNITHMGCFMRGSSGENKSAHKKFKQLVSNTNRHVGRIDSHLLYCWVDCFDYSSVLKNVVADADDDGCTQGSVAHEEIDSQLRTQCVIKARDVVPSATGQKKPSEIVDIVLTLRCNEKSLLWYRLNMVRFTMNSPPYTELIYKTL